MRHEEHDPYQRTDEANTLLNAAQSIALCQWLAAITDAEMDVWPRRNTAWKWVPRLYSAPDASWRVGVLLTMN